MRFSLSISTDSLQNILPVNYQYELSSCIYRVLNTGNPEFADFLHEKGYLSDNGRFRLFCFSNLIIPEYRLEKDRLRIISPEATLIVSFYPIEAIGSFVTGIFNDQQFTLGDRNSRAAFRIRTVEKQNEPAFTDDMRFRLLSPIHVVRSNPFTPGKTDHLSPEHKDFAPNLFDNLVRKYNAYHAAKEFETRTFSIELLSEPKQKLISIKAGSPQESKLKGYLFDFRLKAAPELIRIGYYAGFGKENSQGFGCGEVIC
ncbi:MAG: CRISPR-associated endoribonuclease Cas6 [Bacteroidetes bacterium]|nr:CRISPR-associated endoribonuclease Cas6 [Bacteroidota bacterium]